MGGDQERRPSGGLAEVLVELSRVVPRLPTVVGEDWPGYSTRLTAVLDEVSAAERSDRDASPDQLELTRARLLRRLLAVLTEVGPVRDLILPVLGRSGTRGDDPQPYLPTVDDAVHRVFDLLAEHRYPPLPPYELAQGHPPPDYGQPQGYRHPEDQEYRQDPGYGGIIGYPGPGQSGQIRYDGGPFGYPGQGGQPYPLDPIGRGPESPAAAEEPEQAETPPGERALRAWLIDSAADELRAGVPVTVGFQVGPAGEPNLLSGNVTVPAGDVPRAGLATRWVLSSRDVRLKLKTVRGKESVPTADGPARVSFALRFPRTGRSHTAKVVVTPITGGPATIQVSVYVGVELYRQCTVSLAVQWEGFGFRTTRPTIAVTEDHVWAATAHTNLRTTHEWTTPPGQVTVTLRPDAGEIEWMEDGPNTKGEQYFSWRPTGDLKGQIGNVRSTLESFREAHTDYLDDLDPVDLTARLAGAGERYLPGVYDWVYLPDQADAAHHERWDGVAGGNELLRLATDGRLLARDLLGDEVVAALAALRPGTRVTVKWRNPSIQSVPWGLLYLGEPGRPVDPFLFVGLRFRFGFSGYRTDRLSKALGGIEEAYRVGLFYWGDDTDEVGVEARWQLEQLRGSERNLLLPLATDPVAAKAEVVDFLARPSPNPATMLYLFCHCTVDDGRNPRLRFGAVPDPEYMLDRFDLSLTSKLADRPVVFANACTTSGAEPDVGNLLESGFFGRGCRAFIGTETRVPVRLASRFARVFFAFLLREVDPRRHPMTVGEAMTQARLFLWTQYRNVGGLFYAYVNEYELYLASEAEVLALRRN